MFGDPLVDLVQLEAEFLGLNDKLFQFPFEQVPPFGARRDRRIRNHGTQPGPHFEQPLVDQVRDDFVRGVGVDPQSLAQGANRRKRIAWPNLSRDQSLLGGINNLLGDRNARLQRDAERDDVCTITPSTLLQSFLSRGSDAPESTARSYWETARQTA